MDTDLGSDVARDAWPTGRSAKRAPWPDRAFLAPGAMIGSAVVLTTAWAVLGRRSTGYALWDIVVSDYSAIHQPISGLGLGNTAGLMNSAFVISGVLAVTGAVGIGRAVSRVDPAVGRRTGRFLALHGLGAVLCGVFTLRSMPLHSLGFALAASPVVTFVVIGRRLRAIAGWQRAARVMRNVASPLLAVLTAAFFATFNPTAAGENRGVAGLTQRALVLALQGSLIALGVFAARQETRRNER